MCKCETLIKAIDAYIAKADDNLSDALDEAGFVKPKVTVKKMGALEDRLTSELEKETKYFKRKAKEAVNLEAFAKDFPSLIDDDKTDGKLSELFVKDFKENIPELAAGYIKQVDPKLTVKTITARTLTWAESWSEKLGRLMKLDSHKEVETLLTDTLKEGKGIADFVRLLSDKDIRSERYRARAVALTETLRAHSVAQQEALTQNPAVESKEWVHTGGYRNSPRENHVAMNGIIVSKDEPFTLEGADGTTYYPMYPRDPVLPPGESVNCHCIHRGIANENILGLSLEERKRLQEEAIKADDEAWEEELDAKNKARAGIEQA